MFCYQCEQADRSGPILGCTLTRGTCGKDERTAALQDLLIYQLKGVADYAAHARALGAGDDDAADFLSFALFTTLTNVNFSPTRFVSLIKQAEMVKERVRSAYESAAAAAGAPAERLTGPAEFVPATTTDALVEQAMSLGILAGIDEVGPDVIGLRALILYGLKGVCAYIHHASVMGYTDSAVLSDVEKALVYLGSDPSDIEELLEYALGLGRTNLAVLDLLNRANSGSFGTPSPARVRMSAVEGKAILVSGHDFPALKALLEQTEGTGINIYTHGEMLPAHGYPELKRRYPHLKGNFGTAWQNQQREFEDIPAPILFTTNCIMPLRASYADRVFTTSVVAYPGVPHIDEGRDFSPVIEKALELGGYAQDTLLPGLNGGSTVTTGFARTAVLQHADEIVQAVRDGKLRHFFLVGGCDGTRPSRRYYTEFARLTPPDTILLTLACGKFRLNDLPLGTVPGTGLPRILDVGQCNDAYSAIRIALALADAFGCGVNDLPLSLVLCWFEQKAVCILIALLALGIRNIRLGPTLPPFLSPVVVAALQQKYDLKAVTTPENDLQAILGRH